MSAAIDPYILFEVNLQRSPSGTGEEQMLVIQRFDNRIVAEIDLQIEGSVVVGDDPVIHVVGLEIVVGSLPLYAPVTVGDTDLVPVGILRELDEEGAGLDLVPDLLREFGDALVVGVLAFEAETIHAVPADSSETFGIRIRPDDGLLGLPVTAFGAGLVLQFRNQDFPSVIGVQLGYVSAFEDLLRQRDDDIVRSLAVESFLRDDERIAIRVQNFKTADELQVLTVNGQLFAAGNLLAFLLGETGYDSRTQGQVLGGLCGIIGRIDDEFTACSGDAVRSGDADHVIADNLEIGDFDISRENDFAGTQEAGSVDGHRLAGDHLGREEHLDAQPEIFHAVVRIQDVAGREGPHQDDGQEYSNVFR